MSDPKIDNFMKSFSELTEASKKPGIQPEQLKQLQSQLFSLIEESMSENERAAFRLVTQMRTALSKESDRGAALYVSSYVDKMLAECLKKFFVANHSVSQEFIYGNGPLATFSSRINISYLLGMITSEERHDLNIVRKIRNDFAHSSEDITFEHQSIKSKCDNFKSASPQTGRENPTSRLKYISVAIGLIARLNNVSSRIQSIEEKRDFEEVNSKVKDIWTEFNSKKY